jgi:hypothetical protein
MTRNGRRGLICEYMLSFRKKIAINRAIRGNTIAVSFINRASMKKIRQIIHALIAPFLKN